ncbi:MAG: arsenite efflux transporter metallochaperone ArsD [Planctomycetaceae bacterium]|nr:arsenite efflux transporter metallochaperone ArsD [Planctomycetaceae bacterium]
MTTTLQIYDRPMCCSTGICGPSVDPVLPRFAADLDVLRKAGVIVDRYNLAQQPQAFVENAEIQTLMASAGVDVLPVTVVNGRVVSRGLYPSLELLQQWTGVAGNTVPAAVASPAKSLLSLPVMDQGCCSESSGCC